jgi:hypothetical protein
MQLMPCGRISHRSRLPGAAISLAPGQAWTNDGSKDFVALAALSVSEIANVVAK